MRSPAQYHENYPGDRMDIARSWSSHFLLAEHDPTAPCLAYGAR